MFRLNGFTYLGQPAQRPGEPVTLYRGSPAHRISSTSRRPPPPSRRRFTELHCEPRVSLAGPAWHLSGRYHLSTTAKMSRALKISISSPLYLISVPPYLL